MGVAAVLAVAATLSNPVQAKPAEQSAAALETVALSALPREAQSMYRLILAGGPFRHSQDGIVFGNRERILPVMPRGYYHEYTVTTPGARNRGARRLVCGGEPPTRPDACFYTDDHYVSFKKLAP